MEKILFKIGRYCFDDDIMGLADKTGLPQVKVYVPDRTIVVMGRGSNPDLEIIAENCARDGVPVLKRQGGGCSVLLDPGDIIVSVAARAEGIGMNDAYFKIFSDLLMGCLRKAGFDGVYGDGHSDIALGGKKITGSCIYRTKGLLYYSASVLVSPRVELMERYLRHPPREPKYRGGRGHSDFVACLAHYGACDVIGLKKILMEMMTPDVISAALLSVSPRS